MKNAGFGHMNSRISSKDKSYDLYHKWDVLINSFLRGENVSLALEKLSFSIKWNKEEIKDYPNEANIPFVELFCYFVENIKINTKDAFSAISIVSFFSKNSKKFPIDIFSNIDTLNIIMEAMKISDKPICNCLILILSSIVHHKNVFVSYLVESDFLNFLKSKFLITCSNMPILLKEYIYFPEIDECIINIIINLFSCYLKQNNKNLILNTLYAIDELVTSEFEIDLWFFYNSLERILNFGTHIFIPAITSIITKKQNFPFCYDKFYEIIIKNSYNIIPPIMKMVRKKYDEWHDFIDPNTLLNLLNNNVLEDLCYIDEIEIFKTFLIYQNNIKEYDTNMITFLLKYISNPEIGDKCILALINVIKNNNLTNEQKSDLIEKIESNLSTIEELIILDYNFANHASIFIDIYNDFKN